MVPLDYNRNFSDYHPGIATFMNIVYFIISVFIAAGLDLANELEPEIAYLMCTSLCVFIRSRFWKPMWLGFNEVCKARDIQHYRRIDVALITEEAREAAIQDIANRPTGLGPSYFVFAIPFVIMYGIGFLVLSS